MAARAVLSADAGLLVRIVVQQLSAAAVTCDHFTVRYDTIRYTTVYDTQRPNADKEPALSAARNQTKKSNSETKKNKKTPDAQKKRSSREVRGVSPEHMEGSLWWERFVKEVGLNLTRSEREKELWMVRVVS